MYAPYLPTSASEFPNDNPELHHGARWVCPLPVSPARAVLRFSPRAVAGTRVPAPAAPRPSWSPVVAPVRSLRPALAREPLQPPAGSSAALAAELPREPFALEADAPPPSRRPPPATAAVALPLPVPSGPLQLDLARIVLPHRVANVPPPPAFIFQPLPSSRRAAAALALALASPPLVPLGYRVVDQRAAGWRVQRRWRVDVAPCVAVLGSPLPATAPAAAPPLALVAALPPELPAVAQPGLVPLASPLPLPPPAAQPEPSPVSGRRRKAPEEHADSGKKQRRRAVRVASSASLMTAALPGNQELSRTLSALEADFAERRLEQPAASRKRRSRRGSAARRAANAV